MVVGYHGPEAAQCVRRDADAELWDVLFEEGADEVFVPLTGCKVIVCQIGSGKAATPRLSHRLAWGRVMLPQDCPAAWTESWLSSLAY